MLEELLSALHNWFPARNGKYAGTFEIKNGGISLPFLKDGQYFRIYGSVFSDGLHQYPESGLNDEVFTGQVWALAIPKAVIDKAQEVKDWVSSQPATSYTSESFAGYSYSRATDENGGVETWQSHFAKDLNRWRRMHDDI